MNEYTSKKQRNLNLDLIRCVAVFSVLSVHFFLNNGFYGEVVNGTRMYIMVLMRTFFMICVPLFLILTGYLMCNKRLSKSYPYGVIRTLVLYILASLFCMLMKGVVFHESYSLNNIIVHLLKFSGAGYSWYIRMYFGLYLLIPFINLFWNGLKSKTQHQVLVLAALMITILPSVLNNYKNIVPGRCASLYPITYYLIGTYIRKYDIKIKKKTNLMLLVPCIIAFGTLNYFLYRYQTFQYTRLVHWGSFENIIDAVLIFLLFLHMPLQNIHEWGRKAILKISELSLVIYLVSECFDRLFYGVLNTKVPVMQKRLEWYPVIVLSVFCCSMIVAQVIVWVYNFVYKKCKGV